jgi:mRNA-degrading endonuclease RelE of RelBE toxin-antitoxin system
MAYRYEFLEVAAKDLFKLTQRDHLLLHALVTEHIPAILRDPYAAGEPKKGPLAGLRAYNLKVKNVVYRVVYAIEGDVVRSVAIGPHGEAYACAGRRT